MGTYIITSLSTDNDRRDYECSAIIRTSPVIRSSGYITMDVAGTYTLLWVMWPIKLACTTLWAYVTQSWETVPNCTSGKIKLTPSAYSHTTVLLVSRLNFNLLTRGRLWQGWLHGDLKGSNGGFRHWQVSGLAVSSVAACFSSPNVHSVNFASFQPLKNQQSPSRLVFGLNWCPTTILNHNISPPIHPPPPTQCKHPWYYLTRPTSQFFLSYLVGTSVICEQQLVLGKLSTQWNSLPFL